MCPVRATAGTRRRWPKLFRSTTTPWGPCTSPEPLASPPGHIHSPSHLGRQVQVCTWFASRRVLIRASCASTPSHPTPKPPLPSPTAVTTPCESGPDTVQREAGRKAGEGETNPTLDSECKTLLLKTNQRQTRHYYAISNQPTALLSTLIGPHPHHRPVCSSLLASIPFSPVTSFHFLFFLSLSFVLVLSALLPSPVPQVSLRSGS